MPSEPLHAAASLGRRAWPNAALVLVAHGSVRDDAREPVLRHAAAIDRRGLFAETAVGFTGRNPDLVQALDGISADSVYVVPCFLAHGHFTQTVIPAILAEAAEKSDRRIHCCAPIGTSTRLAELVRRRVASMCRRHGLHMASVKVLLIGHGTMRHAESSGVTRDLVASLTSRRWFRAVGPAFLEEAPSIAGSVAALELAGGGAVVAVGLFAADGQHGAEDVPGLLDRARAPGRTLYYAGAIGAGPGMPGLILERVQAHDAAGRN